jgi:SAM-dependent methyltransferase
MPANDQADLSRIYAQRFSSQLAYRNRVWRILVADFFSKYIPENASVLDLGCGYGEFINHVRAASKFGMDLNPDTPAHLNPDVFFLTRCRENARSQTCLLRPTSRCRFSGHFSVSNFS